MSINSFSSYTKGLYMVSDVILKNESAELKIRFPFDFQSKLEKRNEKFGCSALSLDGVYAEISMIKEVDRENHDFEVIAKIALDQFRNSTLQNVNQGSLVNIGMISKNSNKWLLDATKAYKVKLHNIEIAKGHAYRKELNFECSKEIFLKLEKFEYIGLNASGLLINTTFILDGRYYFSIHAGRNTQEKTLLGSKDLSIGTEFNLTFPFIA